jgi:hypothetical protein
MNTLKSNVMTLANKKFKGFKSKYRINVKELPLLWSKCLKWAWKVTRVDQIINVWGNGVQDMIMSGVLPMVRGNIVKCGENATHSAIYVSHTKHSIHLIHWQGSKEATERKFRLAVGNLFRNKKGVTL